MGREFSLDTMVANALAADARDILLRDEAVDFGGAEFLKLSILFCMSFFIRSKLRCNLPTTGPC